MFTAMVTCIARRQRLPRSNSGNGNLRPETFGVTRRERSSQPARLTAETGFARTGYGNLALFLAAGNHVGSPRLPGGAEGIRTPDLCSAIAALSHLSYSPVARVFTCVSKPCQRRGRGGSSLLRCHRGGLKVLENSCARSSTS